MRQIIINMVAFGVAGGVTFPHLTLLQFIIVLTCLVTVQINSYIHD